MDLDCLSDNWANISQLLMIGPTEKGHIFKIH